MAEIWGSLQAYVISILIKSSGCKLILSTLRCPVIRPASAAAWEHQHGLNMLFSFRVPRTEAKHGLLKIEHL